MNIAGLALGIACAIVSYFNWDFHANFDKQHIKYEGVVKVNTERIQSGISEKHAIAPSLLGKQAKATISSVSDFARYTSRNGNVRRDDKILTQQIAFADPSFLTLFHFPMLAGTNTAMNSQNQILITKKTEITYFGQESGLDKELTLLLGDEKYEFLIGGVIDDHKLNSSFKFDILINLDAYERLYNQDLNSWSTMTDATFVRISNQSKIQEVERLLGQFIPPQNQANEEWQASAYYLTPFSEMGDEARYLRSNRLGQNNPEGTIMIPTIMAVMILLIACFNFTNTSIAIAGNRVKEIGVRKALGAKKGQLQGQLLVESMLIVSISLALGMLLAEFLLPLYSGLGPWIDLHSNYSDNLPFFVFLILLTVTTGLLASAYPALYISSFNVISIFRKKVKVKDTNWLTKSLLVLQISFSLMAIIQGVVYVQNSALQKEFDLGFDRNSIISIPLTDDSNYSGLMNRLSEIPDITSVAMTNHHIGYSQSGGKFKTTTLETDVRLFEIAPDYITTMEIELIEGRSFHKDNESDKLSSIIVNETLIQQFNIEDLSSTYTFDDQNYQIIGVVKDFYPYGLWRGETNHPVVFKVSSTDDYQYMIVNTGFTDIVVMNGLIKEYWKEFNPELPYEGELNNKQVYLSELLSNNMTYFSFFQAIVASLLSITGLFTMVSLNIQNRNKEMGIRKIFGASSATILKLLNTQIIWVLLIASMIGVVSSYYLTELFLDIMFSIHAQVNTLTVLVSIAALVILAYSVVGYKLMISSKENPIEALRQE